MSIEIGIINKSNIDEDLKKYFSFNADLSGANGEEYTSEEALELGVTDLDLLIIEATKRELNFENKIDFMLSKVSEDFQSCCITDYKYQVLDEDKFLLVFTIIQRS